MSTPLLPPSSIPTQCSLAGSILGHGEAELSAVCVTAYLGSGQHNWTEHEFSWVAIATWLQQYAEESLNELYIRLLGTYGLNYFQRGLLELAGDGYLTQRNGDDDTYFIATQKLAELMQPHANCANS